MRLGLTNEEVAARLGITLDGAKYHVSQILAKLGVSTREEAASVAARENWWQRLGTWGLAAKVALAAAGGAAVVGVAILALGVASSGTGDVRATTYVGQIGSFEDTHNFAAFAQGLAQAVDKKDVNWFIDHTPYLCTTNEQECISGHSVNAEQGVGLRAQYHGTDQTPIYLTGDAYKSFLQSFFDAESPRQSDEFGAGGASLNAIAVSGLSGIATPSDVRDIEAIVTAIVQPLTTPLAPPLTGRAFLSFRVGFIANRAWAIYQIDIGDSADNGGSTIASVLSPPGPPVRTNGTIPEYGWSYWQRWPLVSPSP